MRFGSVFEYGNGYGFSPTPVRIATSSLNRFVKMSVFLNSFQKFELLIYDWILSSQTHLWTKKRSADLDLFNQTLKKFKKIAVNYPQISYKIQMYETVMMYTSNRNPINLVQPAKQFLFSKSKLAAPRLHKLACQQQQQTSNVLFSSLKATRRRSTR